MTKANIPLFKRKAFSILIDGIWDNNAIFGMVLGMCSSLAVTTKVGALSKSQLTAFIDSNI